MAASASSFSAALARPDGGPRAEPRQHVLPARPKAILVAPFGPCRFLSLREPASQAPFLALLGVLAAPACESVFPAGRR